MNKEIVESLKDIRYHLIVGEDLRAAELIRVLELYFTYQLKTKEKS